MAKSTSSEVQNPERLTPAHEHWPPLWRCLTDPPRAVTIAGQKTCLSARALAIVGTRRPTPRGLAVAAGLAEDLAAAGWVIVSGLALGIDGAAHLGAMRAGGATVAVMGTGIAHTYPPQHRNLRLDIEKCGCVVSEFTDDAWAARWHFPQRNRLIAGMAEGVIVVDAPARSGALLTALMAMDLNRDVFAVPGPVDRPESRGCHHLLREGAILLESVLDVHRELGPPGTLSEEDDSTGSPGPAGQLPAGLVPAAGSAARWIWDRLDLEPTLSAELAQRWPGNASSWSEGLLALELADLIRRLPGGKLVRKRWDGGQDRGCQGRTTKL